MKAIWRGSLGVQLVAILLVAFLVTPALGGTLPPPSAAGTTTDLTDEELSEITGEAIHILAVIAALGVKAAAVIVSYVLSAAKVMKMTVVACARSDPCRQFAADTIALELARYISDPVKYRQWMQNIRNRGIFW